MDRRPDRGVCRGTTLGNPEALLGVREITVSMGYASGIPSIAHIGLGTRTSVDLRVVLPRGGGVIERSGVGADGQLELS